eukprot:gene1828-4927_t
MSGRDEAFKHFLTTGELLDAKTISSRIQDRQTLPTSRTSSLYFTDNDDEHRSTAKNQRRWIKAARQVLQTQEKHEPDAPGTQDFITGQPKQSSSINSEQSLARQPFRAPRVNLRTKKEASSVSESSERDTLSPPSTAKSRTRKPLFDFVAEEVSQSTEQKPKETNVSYEAGNAESHISLQNREDMRNKEQKQQHMSPLQGEKKILNLHSTSSVIKNADKLSNFQNSVGEKMPTNLVDTSKSSNHEISGAEKADATSTRPVSSTISSASDSLEPTPTHGSNLTDPLNFQKVPKSSEHLTSKMLKQLSRVQVDSLQPDTKLTVNEVDAIDGETWEQQQQNSSSPVQNDSTAMKSHGHELSGRDENSDIDAVTKNQSSAKSSHQNISEPSIEQQDQQAQQASFGLQNIQANPAQGKLHVVKGMQSFEEFFTGMDVSDDSSNLSPTPVTTQSALHSSQRNYVEEQQGRNNLNPTPPFETQQIPNRNDQMGQKDLLQLKAGTAVPQKANEHTARTLALPINDSFSNDANEESHADASHLHVTPSMIPRHDKHFTSIGESRHSIDRIQSPLRTSDHGSKLPVASKYTNDNCDSDERAQNSTSSRRKSQVTFPFSQFDSHHPDSIKKLTAKESMSHEPPVAEKMIDVDNIIQFAVNHKVQALQAENKRLTGMLNVTSTDSSAMKVLEEQEHMLSTLQSENNRLYHLIKEGDISTKQMVAHMQAENERLVAANFSLRSRNEVLEQQMLGSGKITNSRIVELENKLSDIAKEKDEAEKNLHERCRLLQEQVHQLEEKRSLLETLFREQSETKVVPLETQVKALKRENMILSNNVIELKNKLLRAQEHTDVHQNDHNDDTEQREEYGGKVAVSKESNEESCKLKNGNLFETKLLEKENEIGKLQHELKHQKDEMRSKVEAFQNQVLELQDAFKKRNGELEAKVRELRHSSSRPHTRVKELEQELEAVKQRYKTIEQEHSEQTQLEQATTRLEADRHALQSKCKQLERDVVAMKDLRGKYDAARANIKDLEQRLEAALQLAEDNRKAKRFAEEKARVTSEQLHRDLKSKINRLEKQLLEKEQQASVINGLEKTVNHLTKKFESVPTHEQIALYERSIRDLELQLRDKDAELAVAQKYHSPSMQHYNLLLQRISELETKQQEREQQVKQLLLQRDRARALDAEELNNKWREAFLEKASQVTSLNQRLDEMMSVLKILKARGVQLPRAAVPTTWATPP